MSTQLTDCSYCNPYSNSTNPLDIIFECNQIEQALIIFTKRLEPVEKTVLSIAFDPNTLAPHFKPPIPYKLTIEFSCDIFVRGIINNYSNKDLQFKLIRKDSLGTETTLATWIQNVGVQKGQERQYYFTHPYTACLNCDIGCTEYFINIVLPFDDEDNGAYVKLENCYLTAFAQGKYEPRRYPEPRP